MKRLNVAAAILGLGVLASIVWKIGPAAIATNLQHVWMGFALLLLLSLIRLLLRTCSWLISLSANKLSHSVGELIGIRTASQSLAYLSALGPFLSEPLKIRLLGNSTESATSTLADTGMCWFSAALFGISGSVACGLLLMRRCHVIWVSLFSIAMLCGLVILARKKPLLTSVIDLLGSRSPRWLYKGALIEGEIRRFRFVRPQAVHRMFWIDLICQVSKAGEVAVMLWAFGVHLSLLTILAIEICTRAVKLVAGWLPARIGADETGAVAAFVALGLSPASGLILALARRCRDLLWCVGGLLWLGWNARRPKAERVLGVKEEVPCSL